MPEALVGAIAAAAGAEVELWSEPGRRYPVQLRELSPVADAATRTYEARFTLPADADPALGMSATVTLRPGGGAADGGAADLGADRHRLRALGLGGRGGRPAGGAAGGRRGLRRRVGADREPGSPAASGWSCSARTGSQAGAPVRTLAAEG